MSENCKTSPEGNGAPPFAGAHCSAALLEIIKTCEEYQNNDCEGVELILQCDEAYRTICKVIRIASGKLAELEAQQGLRDSAL